MITRTAQQDPIKYAHQNLFICVLKRCHNVDFAVAAATSFASEIPDVSDFDMMDAKLLCRYLSCL
jgi:hypothetical protein